MVYLKFSFQNQKNKKDPSCAFYPGNVFVLKAIQKAAKPQNF